MKKTWQVIFVVSLLIQLLLLACVSQAATKAPTPEPKQANTAPDWFNKTPADDATYKYFVGSGSSSKKDAKEAEEYAVMDLIDQILRYVGVEVKSESEAKALGSVDEIRTEISKVVSTSGKAQFAGFEIMEKLPNEKTDNLIIYILCRYNKQDLEKEKQKIQHEIDERYKAISGPENEGKDFFENGQYYQAAVKFMQAARAAAKAAEAGNVSNVVVKFERNIKQAMDAVENINLFPLTNKITGFSGEALPQTFDLKVVSGGAQTAPGVPDVALTISYKDFNAAKTDLRTKSAPGKTDEKGIAVFSHPIPRFVGKETVTMVLNFDEYTGSLDDVPDDWYDSVKALKALIADKKVVFEFSVTSNAKNIDTGIAVIDMDQDNQPYTSSKVAPALLKYLSAEKYKIKTLNVKAEQLVDQSDADIIDFLAANFADKVERVLFGTAAIQNKSKDDGKTIVKTSATIQVIDLASGELLLSVVKSANGMGNNDEQAVAAAFKNLGEEIGKYVLNNLY